MRTGALFILFAAVASVAVAAPKAPMSAGQKLMQSCDAHKFETVVDVIVDGQPHHSKVKLCGVEGQSDAEWLDTLRDAIKKLEANKEMPPAQREQIVTAIRAEVSRLSIITAGPRLPLPSRQAEAVPAQPLSRDYPTLPPLPTPIDGQALPVDKSSAALAAAAEQRGLRATDNAPQAPVPPLRNQRPNSAPASAMAKAAAAPRLRFGCDTPGELTSDAPCAEFARDTVITVHAGDDLPPGTLLQFVRNDDPRAEVTLGGLRRGGTLRMPLPAKVCAGFASGKLELRVVDANEDGAPQPLVSDGPYVLRC